MKIFGLGGTNGSGKDTVAAMLVDRHGFYFASATDMLRDELERRGLPTDRTHKSKLSAEWRRQYGGAAIVDRAWEYYQQHEAEYQGMIVGSLRHPAEVDRIHELGGQQIWTDADPHVRYKRIIDNAHLRGRPAEDDKCFDEWQADEHREMYPEGDEATLHGAAVKDRADIVIENNDNDIEAFKDQAEQALGLA